MGLSGPGPRKAISRAQSSAARTAVSQGTKHGDQCVKNGLWLLPSDLGVDLRGHRGLEERASGRAREL